jgi:carbon storage regulator CsrA
MGLNSDSGIEAPEDVEIWREEIYERIQEARAE